MKQSFLVTPVLTLSFLTKDCISKKRNFSISIPGSRIKGIDEKCFLSHRALFNALNNNTNLFTISNFFVTTINANVKINGPSLANS